MASPSKVVDPDPAVATHRTVPMQVLALGFPRTGTSSLKTALETLGYVRTDHGSAVATSSPEKKDMWIAALKAKIDGDGTPFGREEWDRLLGDCQAVTDVPHILFAEELIAAYPDAKVVLTTRDVDSWWRSYEATVVEAMKPAVHAPLRHAYSPAYSKTLDLFELVHVVLFGTAHVTGEIAKARFAAHYDEIRRLAPADRLLEFEVKEGWVPLSAFLSKEVPPTAFPLVNDMAQFKQGISDLIRSM
ncbi:P-loop containing nucleoside triphosphate hydrolase protein [Mycena vulgaris]|nr:P-loop containing nucleoside triphosphate hydrolase protein [Mycena vulgaris]